MLQGQTKLKNSNPYAEPRKRMGRRSPWEGTTGTFAWRAWGWAV